MVSDFLFNRLQYLAEKVGESEVILMLADMLPSDMVDDAISARLTAETAAEGIELGSEGVIVYRMYHKVGDRMIFIGEYENIDEAKSVIWDMFDELIEYDTEFAKLPDKEWEKTYDAYKAEFEITAYKRNADGSMEAMPI